MNEVFVMKGGNPLSGEVVISGAKNAALGIVAGALLTDEEVIIENLPDVRDINVMLEALRGHRSEGAPHRKSCGLYSGGSVVYEKRR